MREEKEEERKSEVKRTDEGREGRGEEQ